MTSSLSRLHDLTQTHHIRWESSRRVISPTQRNLLHNTHKKQTTMLPTGLEPATSANERAQTRALDRAVTGMGN